MKLSIKIVVILINLTATLSAAINYRKAMLKDLPQLLALYQAIETDMAQGTDDSLDRIVVYPHEVRSEILAANIKAGKLFVATDQDQVVAFLKLFLITNGSELDDILHGELKLGLSECLHTGMFELSTQPLNTYHRLERSSIESQDQGFLEDLCKGCSETAYIYVGGAYTVPAYRSQQINSKLTSIALQHVATDEVCNVVASFDSATIALVYGQVEANAGQQRFIRPFARIAQTIRAGLGMYMGTIEILSTAYRAYKPILTLTENNKLAPLPLTPEIEARTRGQGTLLAVVL